MNTNEQRKLKVANDWNNLLESAEIPIDSEDQNQVVTALIQNGCSVTAQVDYVRTSDITKAREWIIGRIKSAISGIATLSESTKDEIQVALSSKIILRAQEFNVRQDSGEAILEQVMNRLELNVCQKLTKTQTINYNKAIQALEYDSTRFSPAKTETITTLTQKWEIIYSPFIQSLAMTSIPAAKTVPNKIKIGEELASWQEAYKSGADENAQHKSFARLLDLLCKKPSDSNSRVISTNIERCFHGIVWHTSAYNYIKTESEFLKPDFAVHLSGDIDNCYGCAFVFELQVKPSENTPFDKLHLAKILTYNEAILNANPIRNFVISILTNMEKVSFMKTERQDDEQKFYKYEHSSCELELMPALNKLLYALKNPQVMGYVKPPSIEYKAQIFPVDKYIGKGANSRVYRTIKFDKRRYVIKIYNDHPISSIENERNMYEKFKGVDGFPQLEEYVEKQNALILSPYGHRIDDESSWLAIHSKEELEAILEILECLRRNRVVHRDICPGHFYWTMDERDESKRQIFLIDFSSATNEGEQTQYCGSTVFAANEIYKAYAEHATDNYIPRFRHDWEGLVKCLIYFWCPNYRVKICQFVRAKKKSLTKFKTEDLLNLWIEIETSLEQFSPLLYQILKLTRSAETPEQFLEIRSRILQFYDITISD